MKNEKIIDMAVIKSIKELEKLGATNLFRKQILNLLDHAPHYVMQIEKSLLVHNKKDLCSYAKALNSDASSVGAVKLHAICQELMNAPMDATNAQVAEIMSNLRVIVRDTEAELKQLIAS